MPLSSRLLETLEALKRETTQHILQVMVGEQKLEHYVGGKLRRSYTVSTSRRPPSCVEDSLGTPDGLHEVADKLGEGAPAGMVFRGRQPIGRCYWEMSAEENIPNLVTTRILRLRGLQPGKNAGPGCDTYDRYVYIHGTNHETRLGNPDTAGCVALSNTEVIELFNTVPEGSLVWIELPEG